MWAHVERFGIDELVAADAGGATVSGLRAFAVQIPELTSIGAHWHDYYELGYVLEGEARHVVNGHGSTVGPGSAFLLSPADVHAIEARGGSPLVMVNAVLHPELVERTLESVHAVGDLPLPWQTRSLPAVADDVARVRDELASRAPGWDRLVECSLIGILVQVARASSVDRRAVRPDATDASADVRRAVRHVEQHFREPLTLAQVAAVAHLSPHWFSERFRRTTGEPFQSYLKRRRLQFARALLDSTELGVTEVCHAAGFNDPSYFGRAYRARYGVSPSGRAPAAGR